MTTNIKCPSCYHKAEMIVDHQAYVEVGEWLGNGYEIEYEVDLYVCEECGMQFFI